MSLDRLRELAKMSALRYHYGDGKSVGHVEEFDTCPHPDCALVRSPREQTELEAANRREREMARGFNALWYDHAVQDADDWLYALRKRACLLTDEDDCREAQDNTPSLGPFSPLREDGK